MMKRLRSIAISYAILTLVLMTGRAVAQDDYTSDGDEPTQKLELPDTKSTSLLVGIVVNNNGDGTDATPGDGICETVTGNNTCTLRAAVVEANALAGDDVITFAPAVTSISVTGQIPITSNIAINGGGLGAVTVQNVAPLGTTSRVFNITNFVVSLAGLTITGGMVTGNGGGIQNTGTLTIASCVITGNSANGASGVGGGVRSTNSLTILNSVIRNNSSAASTSGGVSFAGASLTVGTSTISHNTSFGNGGGINISATASVTITRSTISNNTAGASSGGIFTNRGTITNTTISGNTANGALASDGGGGLRIQAGANSVSVTSCTITGNTAPNSAAGARSGIWHETGTLNVTNSIVAANVAQDIQRDGTAVLTSGGFTIIGENTGVTTEFPDGLPNGTNYVGTDAMPLNPMIGPLAYNGGPTFTHALLAGSIAVDKGNSSSATSDQRGYHRNIDLSGTPNAPGGDGSDIGPFELFSAPQLTVSVGGRVTDAGGTGIPKAHVFITDAGGNSRHALTNPFGYYQIGFVGAFENYVVSVNRKGYQFGPRVIFPNNTITNLDFVAEK